MEPVKGLRIRTMKDSDLAPIVEIDKKVAGKDRISSWPQAVSTHFKTYSPPLSFVAEMDNRIIGFIIGIVLGAEYDLPLSGWINIMGVDPEYQGRGVGRMLLKSFVEGCHQRGMKARVLVRQKDERLKKFLAPLGFHQGDVVDFVRGFD